MRTQADASNPNPENVGRLHPILKLNLIGWVADMDFFLTNL